MGKNPASPDPRIGILIGRLLSAVRNSRLYPEGHPILEKLLDDAFASISRQLKGREKLEFKIAGNVLIADGKPLKTSAKAVFSEFISVLGSRQIGLLAFLEGIDRDEMVSFLNVLAEEPDKLQDLGGFAAQLPKHDIHHVIARDISYDSPGSKGITLDWDDFASLLAAPEDLMVQIERSPDSLANLITQAAGGEPGGTGGGDQWARSAVNVLQKIADSLFEAYGRTQPEEYAEGMARLILALSPSAQRLLIDTKGGEAKWSNVIESLVSKIPDEKLVELVVGKYEQVAQDIDAAPEVSSYGQVVERTESFLQKVFTDPKRKERLLPILREKLAGMGFSEEGWRTFLKRTSPESNIFSLFEAELGGRPPLSADTLVTIKMALQSRLDVEKLLRPFIMAIDEENPDTRIYVSEKLREWTKEVVALGRYDLVETVIEKLTNRLRTEDILDVFQSLVLTLREIAVLLLEKEKRSYASRITDAFSDYLGAVKDQPQGKMLAAALGEIGDKTGLRELVSLLGNTPLDEEAGHWIIKNGEKSIEPLLWALRIVEDKNTRLRIVDVLAQFGDHVIPAIIKELKDSRWFVRRNACTVLTKIGSRDQVRPLSYLLRDPVAQVRKEAIVAILSVAGEDAEDLILPMILDSKVTVQHAAINSLAQVGGRKSLISLVDFLQSSKPKGKKEILGRAGLKALGQIGGDAAEAFLKEVLSKRTWRGPKYPEKMRKEAIESLVKLGGGGCTPLFLEATKDKSDLVKAAAVSALRKSSRSKADTTR